ncbi:MAG: hypothetical protein PVJ21_01120 [Anaerolineales bacterium]|jgi:hypothetical protein
MRKLANELSQHNDAASFIGGLWLVAKYGNDGNIKNFTQKTLNIWKSNDWLARQVAALWPRIKTQETKDNLKNTINSFGLTAARLVLDNYQVISSDGYLFSQKVSYYIYALMANNYYPVPKFLVALSVFQGTLSDIVKNTAKEKLLEIVDDPVLRYHLSKVSW